MTGEGAPILVWDTYEIVDSAVRFQLELCGSGQRGEVEIRKGVCSDPDLFTYEWDALCEELTRVMGERGTTHWRVEMRNFGWRRLSGVQELEATTGQELLRKILPKTDNTFKVYSVGKEIHINNAHHDSPTWAEWYIVAPVDEERDEGVPQMS